MKKKNGIIIALCVVVVALIVILAFVLGRNTSKKDEVTSAPTVAPTQATQTAAQTVKSDVSKSDIKVVKKYTTIEDDDYSMVLVLQNNGKADAAVAVTGKIFDGANANVGTERESIFMDPGSQSVVSLDFDTEGIKVKDDDYKISVAAATSVKPGEGDFDLKGVETHVLFYDNGELVDIESEDMIENDSEIFTKGTEVKQSFDTREQFDKVKVYYSQDQEKPDAEDDD